MILKFKNEEAYVYGETQLIYFSDIRECIKRQEDIELYLITPDNIKEQDSNQKVKFSFNTGIGYGSHTGVPVPVYAYGPGSKNFTGTLDNTDIFYAMLEAVDIEDTIGSCVN